MALNALNIHISKLACKFNRVYANFKVKVVLNLSVVQVPHLLNRNDNGSLIIGV